MSHPGATVSWCGSSTSSSDGPRPPRRLHPPGPPSPTGPDAVEIRDHKVTRFVRSPAQLRGDLQLGVYGWLVRATWPWAQRIVVAHHYPLVDTLVRVDLDDDWIAAAVARLTRVSEQALADTDFRPTPGEHCGDCAYADRCDAASIRAA